MLPLSHFCMLLFCFSGGTTVLTTEKPTIIDSTIQSGIKYNRKRSNVVDFPHACPLPQKIADHGASGFQVPSKS